MKKIFLIALLALAAFVNTRAFAGEYVPFVREGVKWVYYVMDNDGTRYHALEIKGDTILGGKAYKVMRRYSGSADFKDEGIVPVCLREEGKVVYAVVPGGVTYTDSPVGFENDSEMMEAIAGGREFVLYDFNDPIGFLDRRSTFYSVIGNTVIPERATVAGNTVNSYISHVSLYDFRMVEGIGFDGMLKAYPLAVLNTESPYRFNLSHVIQGEDVIYRSEQYMKRSTRESVTPVPREGVQWVNERVVINNGDTTRSYYTYAFHGVNSQGYAVCYSYDGGSAEAEDGTFAANMKEEYTNAVSSREVYTCNNVPFNRMIEEKRLMMGRYTHDPGNTPVQIYQFAGDYSSISYSNPQNFYIRTENDDYLDRFNFVEVDPVEVDGVSCRRYAYLGEDGSPRAYVVEGIGFDSSDLGDLLTPFTCPPDPEAGYQEYCGLSHVIKDGKVIYEGMRYRKPLQEWVMMDVDGDGDVSIADVTTLISHLLTGAPEVNGAADVNKDGSINIADVTALINHLLTGI